MEKVLTRSRTSKTLKKIYVYIYICCISLPILVWKIGCICEDFLHFFSGKVTRIDRWTLDRRMSALQETRLQKSSLARKRWKRNLDEGKIKWMDACATIVIKLSQRSVVINR